MNTFDNQSNTIFKDTRAHRTFRQLKLLDFFYDTSMVLCVKTEENQYLRLQYCFWESYVCKDVDMYIIPVHTTITIN